jgi:hypothetical protein
MFFLIWVEESCQSGTNLLQLQGIYNARAYARDIFAASELAPALRYLQIENRAEASRRGGGYGSRKRIFLLRAANALSCDFERAAG